MQRRGPPSRRGVRPREDERRKLEVLWEENCERRKAGRSVFPKDIERRTLTITHTFDADGNQVILQQRGEYAIARQRATDQYFAKLRTKVKHWNRKPGKGGKDVDAKDISGADVMEVLALAFALTNHPAYEAALKAMILHRLSRGGLRRAFVDLQRRHGHDHQMADLGAPDTVGGQEYDIVQRYMAQFGYTSRQAIEHVVADLGMPGPSFSGAVDKVRKAYATRERREVDRQQYLEELSGLRDPDKPR